MIAKITRGSRPGDLAAYLHGPGRRNEHVYEGKAGGAVIGGTLACEGDREGTRWARDMRAAAATRAEISKPIWHMSVRGAPEDRTLTDAEWRDVAQLMGERMGWADRPWVLVRHEDDHVHIAVSRVGFDGSLWHARNDRRAAQTARQEVELAYGLRQVQTRSSEQTRRTPDHQVTQNEYRRGERTGVAPARVVLAERVRVAVAAAEGRGRTEFERVLADADVEHRANVASTGRVAGYSVHLPGHTDDAGDPVWFKASELDRALSWSKIEDRIGPEPQPRKVGLLRRPAPLPEGVPKATVVQAVNTRQAQAGAWWEDRRGQEDARQAAIAKVAADAREQEARMKRLRASMAQSFPVSAQESLRRARPGRGPQPAAQPYVAPSHDRSKGRGR